RRRHAARPPGRRLRPAPVAVDLGRQARTVISRRRRRTRAGPLRVGRGRLTDLGDEGVELHDDAVFAVGDVHTDHGRRLVGGAEVEAEVAEVVSDRYWAGGSENPARGFGLQLDGAACEGLAATDDSVRLVPHHVVGVDLSDGQGSTVRVAFVEDVEKVATQEVGDAAGHG